MGVDSGLPDFRGDTGFWKAYPLYERLKIRFVEMAMPRHFMEDPAFGWGFYGHRTNLYRDTQPHSGFEILKEWIAERDLDAFVVTSNVDGQFQKAGFDEHRIVEIHGSIHHLQCIGPCKPSIWPNEALYEVDFGTMRVSDFPRCPKCGDCARPNVLMFGDFGWIPTRTDLQQSRFDQYLQSAPLPLAVVELGAGTAIPTIRFMTERIGRRAQSKAIRINPRESEISAPNISIPLNAAEALAAINSQLNR